MDQTYAPGPHELQTHGIEAASFEALAELAIANLREQGPSGIVCGPITTGGTGHQMLNFEVFNATIHGLKRRSRTIFSQIPYEFGLRRLAMKWEEEGNEGYCVPILTVFYERLLGSGLITHGWFIPGWTSSRGARFERQKLERIGTPITDLAAEDIRGFLVEAYPYERAMMIAGLLSAS